MSEPTASDRRYRTRGGITIHRSDRETAVGPAAAALVERLDRYPGVFMSSCFEFPGRYTRWDLGFAAPPLAITCRSRNFEVIALEPRGRVLLEPIRAAIAPLAAVASLEADGDRVCGQIHPPVEIVPEEQRSRQPSIFSLLRAVIELFGNDEDQHFGLYGAFGYDLAHQFEPVEIKLERPADQRDLVLFVPDEILVVDHMSDRAVWHRYDFATPTSDTREMPREPKEDGYAPAPPGSEPPENDHEPGQYPAAVDRAKDAFRRGDLFEVVLSQQFSEACADAPSAVFDRLRTLNPAPYCALMNLGAGEFLVAASPEMYVRVEGRRVETCPISGTIARGKDALGDAAQIAKLLNSAKDEAELTMCTDVDRNDKSRICEPGSVRVIGRRQVELYSRLIHTVDHVEGILRPEFDALDAFLSHTWAVTVTGAPKHWAIRFIEAHERSARRWYGGAIGRIGFDGAMNTGLTLRTVRMKDGIAEIRAGATLLYDSEPVAEDEECRLKASALFAAVRAEAAATPVHAPLAQLGPAKRVLLVDHEDSFVHTLANYLRQTGAVVETLRPGLARQMLQEETPDLVVLSPGPGRPEDFGTAETIALVLAKGVPLFGVCLGLQAVAEYFGGQLGQLDEPVHGKPSDVTVKNSALFHGLPARFRVGRYHSLYAARVSLPDDLLKVTAETDDGVIMALEHREMPIAAVQFHPESILSLDDNIGMRLIDNMMTALTGNRGPTTGE
ncbi:MAG: anthranilate synthase component I [Rhodospirillaceae bacterium]|nr:anthranilate synthase component I [Rhodospirillaceae bacterium]